MLDWPDLFWGFVILAALYFLLRFLITFLRQTYFTGNGGASISDRLESLIVLYEPIAIIILLVIFILIQPALHGLVVLILLLLAYLPLRNYIDGRLFLMNNEIEKGQQLKIQDENGILQKIGRLGVTLRTNEGSRFINYSTLIRKGYTLLKGITTGGFHQVILQSEKEETKNIVQQLEYKLLDCPYLDWTYRPEIRKDDSSPEKYDMKFLLHKDKYLQHMITWLEESGLQIQLND